MAVFRGTRISELGPDFWARQCNRLWSRRANAITADVGSRLLLPPRGENRYVRGKNEVIAMQTVSTTLRHVITPAHCESSTGTLGLYLVAETEAGIEGDDEATVWALTCHHVAISQDGKRTKSPATMLLSAEKLRHSADRIC